VRSALFLGASFTALGLFRMRYLWYLFLVGTPIVLAGLAAAGYHYTASVLQVRFNSTLLLILCISLGHGLVMKWIAIARVVLPLR